MTSYTKKAPPAAKTKPGEVDLHRSGSTASFQPQLFDEQIRDAGYLMYWSSAELCPCRSNAQTEQPDPSCKLCDGGGFLYFIPNAPRLSDYNKKCPPAFVDTDVAKATQAIVTAQAQDVQTFERFGEWLTGGANLTSFSWNEIGYRDRFEHFESLMTYRQVLRVPTDGIIRVGNDVKTKVRYRVIKVLRILRIVNGQPIDLTSKVKKNDDGSLDFTGANVVADDIVSVSFRCHPIWIVIEFPMQVRSGRQHSKTTETRLGYEEVLPQHCFVKLDFLLSPR